MIYQDPYNGSDRVFLTLYDDHGSIVDSENEGYVQRCRQAIPIIHNGNNHWLTAKGAYVGQNVESLPADSNDDESTFLLLF